MEVSHKKETFADFIGNASSLRLPMNDLYDSVPESAGDMVDEGTLQPHERPASMLLRTVPAGAMSFR
jgi:hypothetical protein